MVYHSEESSWLTTGKPFLNPGGAMWGRDPVVVHRREESIGFGFGA